MNKSILVIGVAVSAIALNGCSTARGFGQDLEDLGRIIQGENAKNYEQNRSNSGTSTASLSHSASVSSSNYTVVEPSTTTGTTTYIESEPVTTSSVPIAKTYAYPESSTTSGTISQVTPSFGTSGQVKY